MFKKSLAVSFVVAILIVGCDTESSPEPFIPATFDVTSVTNPSLDSQYPNYVVRWLLYLLYQNELGSRESFHVFGKQDESILRNYDLGIAVRMIKAGTLPEWAEPYFLAPPNSWHAMFACAAHYDDGQNPESWPSIGVKMCSTRVPELWAATSVTGDQLSWSEFLLGNPLGWQGY